MLTAVKPETVQSVPEMRAVWKELLPQTEQLNKRAGELKALAKRLSSPEGYESLKKLQKDLEKLRSLELETEALMASARAAGETVEGWLALEWSRRGAEFSGDLRAYFEDRSLAVSLDGMTLTVGSFSVVIEPEKDRAILRYLEEEVALMKLSCEGIFKTWQSQRDAMEKAHTPPGSLASILTTAYDEQCRLQSKAPGARIRLSDVHFQAFVARQSSSLRQNPLQGKVKGYPRYQFAYDLSLLLERQASDLELTHEGRRLRFHQASKSAAGSKANSLKIELDGKVLVLSDLEIAE